MTNKLKHLATALLAFGLSSSTLSAQGTETNEDKFPHIFIGGAGGGFFQLNQKGYDVKNIFTPAGAFNLGAMFNPYVGMRFQYAGWKEKGHTTRLTSNRKYKYGFHTPGLDALVDVTNIFYGKKQHVFHAYAIGGIGFSAGRGHQTDVNDVYLSGQSRFTVDYRAGLQLEARINHLLGVYVEGLAINMHDHNRPELGKAGEWRIQTMIGLNFHLGGKNRVAKPATYTAPVTAENQTVTPQQPTTPPYKRQSPNQSLNHSPHPHPFWKTAAQRCSLQLVKRKYPLIKRSK